MTTDPNLRVDLSADMRRRAGLPPDDGERQPDEPEQPSGLSPAERERAVAAERSRCVEVIRACQLAGKQDLAGQMISSGKSLGDVVQALQAGGAARRLGRA